MFRLLEEDYRMPVDKGKLDDNGYKFVRAQSREVAGRVRKFEVGGFGVRCAGCGGWHEVRVVR